MSVAFPSWPFAQLPLVSSPHTRRPLHRLWASSKASPMSALSPRLAPQSTIPPPAPTPSPPPAPTSGAQPTASTSSGRKPPATSVLIARPFSSFVKPSTLTLPTLTPLRTDQARLRCRIGALLAELPRHRAGQRRSPAPPPRKTRRYVHPVSRLVPQRSAPPGGRQHATPS